MKQVIILLWLIFAASPGFAQKKKKVTPGQNQNNILKRAYSDVITRNNWYFNSQIIYKDMLTNFQQTRKVDYDDLLPFFFHDWSADFSSYNDELETIVKKTSIVSQIRDESRWRDDVFLMLGKARYLQQDYTNAFETFKYIVTTMEGDLSKSVSKYNQKDRYKYLKKKQKEIDKQNKEKKKALDIKNKIKEKLTKKQVKTKEKEIAQTVKERQKALAKKIKLKKKAIKRKSKGKQVKKDYRDVKVGETAKKEDDEKEEEEPEEEVPSAFAPKDSIEKYKNIQIKNLDYIENDQQGVASDTLTDKEKALLEKLSLWEKLKHKKARSEAIVWMSKAAIQRGMMATAKNMILYGQEMRKLSKEQLKELYLTEAYYYIHRNSYDLAIEPLLIALEWCKKDEKIWYYYILSQFYEKLEQPEDASFYLDKATSIRGDYRTRIYAKINKSRIDAEHNYDDVEDIIKLLTKMGKKGNNKSYRSDIYYTLADIHFNRSDFKIAEDTYKLALQNSSENPKNQTLAYVQLSNLYYKQDNFINASTYMDSALVVNDPVIKNKERYYTIRQEGLRLVAENTTKIKENDSLMMLSMLSRSELDEVIASAVKEEKKKSRRERFMPEGSDEFDGFMPMMIPGAPTMITSTNANWYFYNDDLKARGYNEFRMIWGSRKLQDNWRRTTLSFDRPVEVEQEEKKKDLVAISDTTKKEPPLFSRIPKTKEAKDSINQVTMESYYIAAVAFMQNLDDPKKAINYFEKALSKGIDFERLPETYYALYLLYKEVPNLAKSNQYKDLLMSKYPTNILSRNLSYQYADKTEVTKTEKIELLYTFVYNDFQNGEYGKVLSGYNAVHLEHGENILTPKFKFLQALSYGHLDSVNILKNLLSEIVSKYPNHEVRPKASEYLAILNQEKVNFIDDAVSNVKEDKKKKVTGDKTSIYKPDDDNTSLFGMILINSPQINLQDVMKNLKDFNDKYFNEDLLKVSNAFLSVKEPILLIKRFKNKNDGIKYYNKLLDKKAETFGKFNVDAIEVYLISQNNFKELFGSKNIKLYRDFFVNSYLND